MAKPKHRTAKATLRGKPALPAGKRLAVDPWNATKAAELDARPAATRVYLLVDVEGARLIVDGIVPDYVRRQAESALEWNLDDLGRKDGGW